MRYAYCTLRGLGLVVDTPQMDTQRPLDSQLPEVEEGLEAADRLAVWWNCEGKAIAMAA